MSSQPSSKRVALSGLFSRMFQGSSTATTGKISEPSSVNWANSGMAYRGEYSMQNTLEHPSDVVECTLSEVMETSAPLTSSLSLEQVSLFIERLLERKISVPPTFLQALENQASLLSNTPQSGGNTQRAQRQKDSEATAKHTHSTVEEAQTFYVRRMLPSEAERLQGFPTNWTLVDTEQ